LFLENHVFVDGVACVGLFQACSDNFDSKSAPVLGEPQLWKKILGNFVLPIWCIRFVFKLFFIIPV